MTEEEVTRFALQLREAERIRAMIASEEADFVHAGNDEPPRGAASVGKHSSSVRVIATAA